MSPLRRRLLSLYGDRPFAQKIFLQVRASATPFERLACELSGSRRLLDLACGHGLLAHFMSLADASRTVRGLDISPGRIDAASAAAASRRGVSFGVEDIRKPLPSGYDAVSIIDSLHYFARKEQKEILKNCRRALGEGGVLVIREGNGAGGWRHALNYVHEWLMTRLNFTQTASGGGLYFLSVPAMRALLTEAGFSDIRVSPCPKLLPYGDTLYVCR